MLLLPQRNPLAFPAGYAPGFDPSHVASSGISKASTGNVAPVINSFIAQGGNAISIAGLNTPGKAGAISGSIASALDASIGPCVNFATGANRIQFSTIIRTNYTLTYAAIVKFNSLGIGNYLYYEDPNASGLVFRYNSSGGWYSYYFTGSSPAGGYLLSSSDVPYFIAFSSFYDGANLSANFLTRRLDTGQISTGTQTPLATTTSASAQNITNVIGNASGASQGCKTAAVCLSNIYLSMQQLLSWAQDPWSFWYPQTPSVVPDYTQFGYPAFNPGTNTFRLRFGIGNY
jgi:hypothetical protein